MEKMNAQQLHERIRQVLKYKNEIIYADTHILNISEEEEIDNFSVVHYRVYHKNESCFDVIQEYSSEAADGGGDLIYSYLPNVWDGFSNVKELPIEEAYQIVSIFLTNGDKFDGGKFYHLDGYQVSKGIKPRTPIT